MNTKSKDGLYLKNRKLVLETGPSLSWKLQNAEAVSYSCISVCAYLAKLCTMVKIGIQLF